MSKAHTKTTSAKKSKDTARTSTSAKTKTSARRPARAASNNVVTEDRFGERAVKLGFCTHEDVLKAVDVQNQNAQDGKRHKLIGIVLLESGAIDNAQLITILKTYEDGKAPVE